MIPAKHTWTGRLVANYYSGYGLDRAFRRIYYAGDATGPHSEGYGSRIIVEERGMDGSGLRSVDWLPLLVVGNHFCWWDGFIQHRLNRIFFHRRQYVMMLEEQLRRNPVLARCGAFSVRKNSRDALESLNYAAGVLADPANMLIMFPQGRIESIYKETLEFGSGLDYLFRRVRNDFGVVMNVNLVDYGSHPKPSLRICFHCSPGSCFGSGRDLQEAYNDFYRSMKQEQACYWY